MIHCGQPYVGERERELVAQVLASGQLTRGPFCERFEDAFGSWLGRPAHAVSSGTAALHLALLGCGIGRGDEVIVPATTFIATYNAIRYVGATPVVVDVNSKTWMPDPGIVESRITPKTKAIMVVHLYGAPGYVHQDTVVKHYRRTGKRIYVIEDCAEALGAQISGVKCGLWGDVAVFSFYGSKTITTGGEGGAVAWGDPMIGLRMKHLAGQAQTDRRYHHDCVGFNYRMTEMQAAFGLAQLEQLDAFLGARRTVFDWYDAMLPGNFERQQVHKDDTHGCWAYAVAGRYTHRMHARAVERRLESSSIETRPIFPPVVEDYDLRVAWELHHHGLVLPTHTGLTEEDVEKVCRGLRNIVSC